MNKKEDYSAVMAKRLAEVHSEEALAMSAATGDSAYQISDRFLIDEMRKHPWTRKKLKEAGYTHDPNKLAWRRIKAAPDSPKQQKKNRRKNLRRKLHKQKKLKKP